jgi:hypothetical protein
MAKVLTSIVQTDLNHEGITTQELFFSLTFSSKLT